MKIALAQERLLDQVDWISDHGWTLEGYIARYGAREDPARYGEGGEAIYEADIAELARRAQAYEKALRGKVSVTVEERARNFRETINQLPG